MRASDGIRVLAFDFGASSGRAMLGVLSGGKIRLEEIHRFANEPVEMNGTLYWDIQRLWLEVKRGLALAQAAGGFASIAVDTWGVDFGLLRADGSLVECPVHYRDGRTRGLVDAAFVLLPRDEFYAATGIQFMELNTCFQLFALARSRPRLLEEADCLLLMPDLFNFFLSGERAAEYSIASTTQLLDAGARTWSVPVLSALGLPARLLRSIVQPGTIVGSLRPELSAELGIAAPAAPQAGDTPPPAGGTASPAGALAPAVIAVCGHDTQSAVVAVPADPAGGDYVYISCGTWSLVGCEADAPVIGPKSAAYNLTNEGGYGGKITFLKNITGLWLIQESRRQWRREGKDYSFADLAAAAAAAPALRSLVNPDHPDFMAPGDLPSRLRAYCRRTGQAEPLSIGEVVRCVYESLALKHRQAVDEISDCTGRDFEIIHLIGGGAKDELLCRCTAAACGRPVLAGPAEATVLGNICVQLIALGAVADLGAARRLVAGSQPTIRYEPVGAEVDAIDAAAWRAAYERFRALPKPAL